MIDESMDTVPARETAQPSTLILASAGSGKTFRLTNRFIALLAIGEDPSSIIATTFTRVAAGEILTRVMARLADAALGGPQLAELRAHAAPRLTAGHASQMLSKLIGSLGSVGVQTIDSMFIRLAAVVSMELGLPPAWSIEDESADAVRRVDAAEEALRVTAGSHGHTEDDALIELLREASRGEPGRSVHASLMRFVHAGYDALVTAGPDESLWSNPRPPTELLDEASLADAIARLRAVALPATKTGTVNKTWAKAHAALVVAVEQQDYLAAASSTLAEAVRTSGTFSRVPVPEVYAAAAEPVVRHAVSAVLVQRTQAVRAVRTLLERFADAYLSRKRRDGALRFEDVPRLLLEQERWGSGLDRLYYHLDARLRHLLLDEFQDTSATQFRLLEPIIDELVSGDGGSEGRSVFCVGDPKQSLYVWRQAEPGLLPGMSRRWPIFDLEHLSRSWRSSPVVLDAVNRVFSGVSSRAPFAGQRCAAAWDELFETHDAARAELPGEARLHIAAGAERAEQRREHVDELAVSLVRETLTRRPDFSIGVLVRKNARVRALIDRLRTAGIDATERGGAPLTQTPACAALASLLWLIDYPGDTACAHHVRLGPFAAAAELPEDNAIPLWASRRRARLHRSGLAAYLTHLVAQVATGCDAGGLARLRQAIELAERVDSGELGEREPSALATLLRERRVESTHQSRVQVMTVHQSKGAEFDAVVLCDLDGGRSSGAGEVIVDRPNPTGPAAAVTIRPRSEIARLQPELQDLVDRADQRTKLESLCVLYVAMTRARRRLDMVIEGAGKQQPAERHAAVLREALQPDADLNTPGVAWEQRVGDWALEPEHHGSHPSPVNAHGRPQPERIAWTLRERAVPRARRARRISAAGLSQRDAVSSGVVPPRDGAEPGSPDHGGEHRQAPAGTAKADAAVGVDPGDRQQAAIRGEAVHAVFEAIRFIEDEPLPRPNECAEILRDRGLGGELADRWGAAIAQSLRSGPLREALSRARYADWRPTSIETRAEAPLLARLGDDLLSARIDRVVIARDTNGRAVRAEIIDFKTSSGPLHPEQLVVDHGPQLEAYRAALASVLRIEVAKISATVIGLWLDTDSDRLGAAGIAVASGL